MELVKEKEKEEKKKNLSHLLMLLGCGWRGLIPFLYETFCQVAAKYFL